MSRIKKGTNHKFYHLWTMDGEDWACEITPASPRTGGCCQSCGRTTGVFFHDSGPDWSLDNPLSIKSNSPTRQCYTCWLANDGPAVEINRKGEVIKPYRETILFAHSKTEVVKLAKLWKGGAKINKEVKTPWGDVVVLALPEEKNSGEEYTMKCPHCNESIALTVAP